MLHLDVGYRQSGGRCLFMKQTPFGETAMTLLRKYFSPAI
jgi:hypothetical protein